MSTSGYCPPSCLSITSPPECTIFTSCTWCGALGYCGLSADACLNECRDAGDSAVCAYAPSSICDWCDAGIASGYCRRNADPCFATCLAARSTYCPYVAPCTPCAVLGYCLAASPVGDTAQCAAACYELGDGVCVVRSRDLPRERCLVPTILLITRVTAGLLHVRHVLVVRSRGVLEYQRLQLSPVVPVNHVAPRVLHLHVVHVVRRPRVLRAVS